jgi:hypothetical protein
MIRPGVCPPATRLLVLRAFLALGLAAALLGHLHAQAGKTITILMLDGKTGKPIVPSNYVVRVDHLDQIHNEWLKLNDDGTGMVTVPAAATFLSVEGTYHHSMDIYIDCDAGMEKDIHTQHWYSISEIMESGVSAPNECYKGKYTDSTRVPLKPGQFVFYVRETSWHEVPSD